MEQWKPIPGYEGRYEVSSAGAVWSLIRSKPMTQYRLGRPGEKRLAVALSDANGEKKHKTVHRLVALAFLGDQPFPGAVVCHIDSNPFNNSSGNLRWASISDNARDAVLLGTHNRASVERCPRGHKLVHPNLAEAAWEKRRWRTCKACQRAHARCRRRPSLDFQAVSDDYYRQILLGAPA